MRLAPDTNLLSFPSTRTLLHAVALANDMEVIVLPEVMDETLRRLRAVEADRAASAFKGQSNLDEDRQQLIVERVIDAAQTWFMNEIHRSDTAYRAVENTWKLGSQAILLAKNLPKGIVPEAPPVPEGDALILAQAVVHDATVLSTNNLRSIDHDLANEWARRVTGRTSDLVLSPDQTMERLSDGDWGRVARWVACYSARVGELPVGKRRGAIEASLRALEGGGFHETARRTRWAEKTNADFQSAIQAGLQEEPDATRRAHDSEARRRRLVQAAMQTEPS